MCVTFFYPVQWGKGLVYVFVQHLTQPYPDSDWGLWVSPQYKSQSGSHLAFIKVGELFRSEDDLFSLLISAVGAEDAE